MLGLAKMPSLVEKNTVVVVVAVVVFRTTKASSAVANQSYPAQER